MESPFIWLHQLIEVGGYLHILQDVYVKNVSKIFLDKEAEDLGTVAQCI